MPQIIVKIRNDTAKDFVTLSFEWTSELQRLLEALSNNKGKLHIEIETQ